MHVSVCIEAHVPNHYVTTRYRSIHVRYITIQRIGRPHPHLQTRYTDTLSIQYKYRAYTCISHRALYWPRLLALLRDPSATTGGSARFLDPLGFGFDPLAGSVDEDPPLEAATAFSTSFFLVGGGSSLCRVSETECRMCRLNGLDTR